MHKHTAKENIRIAFLLNLGFSILEALGGYLTNSISILTDAIHDFGDSISIGVSYLLEKKSSKPTDSNYTFGYLRYSLLGALITSVILLIGSILAIYNSIKRIIIPQAVNYDAMIIFAVFGVLINGYAAYRTSHAHKHNEKAINLHMLEDVLGWIVVLIGSICIKIFKVFTIDPILSILIALYILYHVYKYVKEVFEIFMEKVPDSLKIEEIKQKVENKYNQIDDIHHIHIWTMDGDNNFMTCHIKLKDDLDNKEISKLKNDIKDYLKSIDITHSTIEIEYNNEECNQKKC